MVRTCDSLEVLQTAGRGRVDGATLVLTHQQLPVPANIVWKLFLLVQEKGPSFFILAR